MYPYLAPGQLINVNLTHVSIYQGNCRLKN